MLCYACRRRKRDKGGDYPRTLKPVCWKCQRKANKALTEELQMKFGEVSVVED